MTKKGRYAIDLETASGSITGVGMANEHGCWYWDVRNVESAMWRQFVFNLTLAGNEFIAHNVMFDGAQLHKNIKEYVRPGVSSWLNFTQCTFALYKMLATEGYTGQQWGLKAAEVEVLGWPESNEKNLYDWLAANKLAKSDMGLAPMEILGPYCAADADACWQLSEVLTKAAQPFPGLRNLHTNCMLPLIKLCAEQCERGMLVDKDKLEIYLASLTDKITAQEGSFRGHKDVAPWLQVYAAENVKAHVAAHPKSKRTAEDFTFNINSKQQLEWLLYDCMGHEAKTMTDSGRRAVTKKVLPWLGEPGKILAEYNRLVKEQGYVSSAISHLDEKSVLHPSFKTPGTLTGRLSGAGGINLQQQPKTLGYLECFTARPGSVLVQLDFSAVEPVVLAEFSRDKALMSLYGPDAKPNDIYLFVAAHIAELGGEIRKYYDPANPTAEGIALAKKHCKHDRGIAKTVYLAKMYNAGAKKIWETLTMGGVKITFAQVQRICDQFDDLFSGVRRFKFDLEREWKNRNGFIMNGLGRPLTVAQFLTKDLVNRFCQSTGHDLLMMFVANIAKLRETRNVPLYPWLIDFHDESIVEVEEQHAEATCALMKEALAMLNRELDPVIPIKGEPTVARTLADIKVEAA